MKSLFVLILLSFGFSNSSLADDSQFQTIPIELQLCSSQSGFGVKHFCALVYGGWNGQEMPVDTQGDTGLMNSLARHIGPVASKSFAFNVSAKVVQRTQQPSRRVNVLVVQGIVTDPSVPRPRSM